MFISLKTKISINVWKLKGNRLLPFSHFQEVAGIEDAVHEITTHAYALCEKQNKEPWKIDLLKCYDDFVKEVEIAKGLRIDPDSVAETQETEENQPKVPAKKKMAKKKN